MTHQHQGSDDDSDDRSDNLTVREPSNTNMTLKSSAIHARGLSDGTDYDVSVTGLSPFIARLSRLFTCIIKSLNVWGFDKTAFKRWQAGYGYYPKKTGASITSTASLESLWNVAQQIGSPKQGFLFG